MVTEGEVCLAIGGEGQVVDLKKRAVCGGDQKSVSELRLVSAGSHMGGFQKKCLQVAVVRLCRGALRERVQACFRLTCANNDPSGCVGSVRELRNFETVRNCLKSEGVWVWIVAMRSHSEFPERSTCCKWAVGDHRGCCIGAVVWCCRWQHVFVEEGRWRRCGCSLCRIAAGEIQGWAARRRGSW